MTRRCTRGHFIPATAPTDACTCILTRHPRRRRTRRPLDPDLWGQGLTALQRHSIRTVPIVGSYL